MKYLVLCLLLVGCAENNISYTIYKQPKSDYECPEVNEKSKNGHIVTVPSRHADEPPTLYICEEEE